MTQSKLIKHENITRGKITIFLGYASGVGKTYAMFQKAKEQLVQGVDIVVAWPDTYEVAENANFLEDLPLIPPNRLEYEGEKHKEMDLTELLKRRPKLAIIDDLAHINAPGSCHLHRYQDIEEVLQAGISVYTTLNIQSVESLVDIVAQITGIEVTETVPDYLLENADQIKFIDLPPEELIDRLKKAEIPRSLQEKKALSKLGNINALRELAFRYTAQNVDKKLINYMKEHNIKGPWPVGDKIMACIGPSPFSAQVLRTARRMAAGLKAQLVVAYVETPYKYPAKESEQDQLSYNLRLAEELGAEIVHLAGNSVSDELIALAGRKNVTQIVIGKPLHSRFRDFWRESIVNDVIRGSHGISVHVIPGKPKKIKKAKQVHGSAKSQRDSIWPYVGTNLFIIAITIFNKLLEPAFDLTNIALLYLLPVLFSAVYWGQGPSIMASLVGVLAFDIFFVPPVLSITVADLRYLLSFAIFLLVALITSNMAIRLSNQANLARVREARTGALYALSRKIVAETDIEGVLNTAVNVVSETIGGKAIIYISNKDKLEIGTTTALPSGALLGVNERETADWVFKHGEAAGKGTGTFNKANASYLPLRSDEENLGVLGVQTETPKEYLSQEQRRLLEAFANLIAVAVIRLQLAEEAQKAQYLAKSEKLRTVLFNSISHEIRTPLASIIGAVSSLLEQGDVFSKKDEIALLRTVNESAHRMDRLVRNMFDMARLESGKLKLKLEWCDIQDIIGVALRRMKESTVYHKLRVKVNPNLPLVKADFALLEQVLINLIENAIKYTLSGNEILLEVVRQGNEVKWTVANQGEVIPDKEKEKIFNEFYRSYNPERKTEGTGLGLAICKGIIEAHGGRIWLENGPNQWNVFAFTLPLQDNPPNQILE